MANPELTQQRWQQFKRRVYEVRTENPDARYDDVNGGWAEFPSGEQEPNFRVVENPHERDRLRKTRARIKGTQDRTTTPLTVQVLLNNEPARFEPHPSVVDLFNKLDERFNEDPDKKPGYEEGSTIIQKDITDFSRITINRTEKTLATAFHVSHWIIQKKGNIKKYYLDQQFALHSNGAFASFEFMVTQGGVTQDTKLIAKYSPHMPNFTEAVARSLENFRGILQPYLSSAASRQEQISQ